MDMHKRNGFGPGRLYKLDDRLYKFELLLVNTMLCLVTTLLQVLKSQNGSWMMNERR